MEYNSSVRLALAEVIDTSIAWTVTTGDTSVVLSTTTPNVPPPPDQPSDLQVRHLLQTSYLLEEPRRGRYSGKRSQREVHHRELQF
jgi:hypothetical protein